MLDLTAAGHVRVGHSETSPRADHEGMDDGYFIKAAFDCLVVIDLILCSYKTRSFSPFGGLYRGKDSCVTLGPLLWHSNNLMNSEGLFGKQ